MSELIPVLGYNRVSSDEQAKYGHSLEIQPLMHKVWCRNHGYDLIDVVTDPGVSAGKKRFEDRPGGKEIMQRLLNGEAMGMVVTRFDRAFRMAVDGLLQLDWFLDRGLLVTSIEMPIDLRTNWGWRVYAQQVVDAEYERRTIIERARETTEGLIQLRRKFGPVPFGLTEKDGQLYRDPFTWVHRENIVSMSQFKSMDTIAKTLRVMNVPAPNGGRLWSKSTIKTIIDTHHKYKEYPYLSFCHETSVSGNGDAA